jgi:CpeT protein
MKYFILSIFLIVTSLSYSQTEKENAKNMKRFCKFLQGRFNSEKQSKADTTYFNISLVILPIWKDRTDGTWFYIEQAMAAKLEKPYRQRVYQIKAGNLDTIISVIYQFDSALNYAQLYKTDPEMTKLSYDKITAKEGCEVYMKPQADGTFKGGTKANNCPSTLKGSTYATTEVTLMKKQLLSWDRGFDKENKHVWGADKGGYVFDRKN